MDESLRIAAGDFNWGAFCMAPVWLLFHGRAGVGLLILFLQMLFFLFMKSDGVGPAIGLGIALVQLVVAIYYGHHGNRIALQHGRYTTAAALNRAEFLWGLGGGIGLLLVVGASIYGFVLLSRLYGR
jgi:hypothetical protein